GEVQRLEPHQLGEGRIQLGLAVLDVVDVDQLLARLDTMREELQRGPELGLGGADAAAPGLDLPRPGPPPRAHAVDVAGPRAVGRGPGGGRPPPARPGGATAGRRASAPAAAPAAARSPRPRGIARP